jgi:hypothetical protein
LRTRHCRRVRQPGLIIAVAAGRTRFTNIANGSAGRRRDCGARPFDGGTVVSEDGFLDGFDAPNREFM